jgi:hypothetical protein
MAEEGAKRGRGRPKGSTNKPKVEAGTAAPGIGHNSLTDEQTRKLALQHIDKIAAKKAKVDSEVSDLRNLYRAAKADNISKAQIDFAIALRKDSDDEMTKKQAALMQAAAWIGHPLGKQFDLFGVEDRTPSDERAYEEGKIEGMRGGERMPPSHYSPAAKALYAQGYDEGQAVNVPKQLEPEPDSKLIKGSTSSAIDPLADAGDAPAPTPAEKKPAKATKPAEDKPTTEAETQAEYRQRVAAHIAKAEATIDLAKERLAREAADKEAGKGATA